MFGYKDGTTYGIVVRRIFAGSLAIVAFVLAAVFAYAGYEAISEEIRQKQYCKSELTERQLSPNISFMENYYTWKDSYLFNYETRKKMHKGKIAWIVRSDDGDSLAVFSDGKKRGYINRFTGEIQIPAEYDHAWIFSDSAANVQQGNKAFFIDHDGYPICDKTFAPPLDKTEGYVFHKGFCAVAMKENDWGLIDREGNWMLDSCKAIRSETHAGRTYWVITDQEGYEGVRNEILGYVLMTEYKDIAFDETGIYVTNSWQGSRSKYDFNGDEAEDFVVRDVYMLYYETDEEDKEGNPISKQSLCQKYSIDDDHYGLMSADGKPLTPAIYTNIDAISKDRFACSLAWNENVILDSQGRKVGK